MDYLRTGRPEDGVIVQDAGDLSRWFSFHLVRTGAGERQLLIVRDVSREHHAAGHAQGLRGERFA